jgi:hypothetical protein
VVSCSGPIPGRTGLCGPLRRQARLETEESERHGLRETGGCCTRALRRKNITAKRVFPARGPNTRCALTASRLSGATHHSAMSSLMARSGTAGVSHCPAPSVSSTCDGDCRIPINLPLLCCRRGGPTRRRRQGAGDIWRPPAASRRPRGPRTRKLGCRRTAHHTRDSPPPAIMITSPCCNERRATRTNLPDTTSRQLRCADRHDSRSPVVKALAGVMRRRLLDSPRPTLGPRCARVASQSPATSCARCVPGTGGSRTSGWRGGTGAPMHRCGRTHHPSP